MVGIDWGWDAGRKPGNNNRFTATVQNIHFSSSRYINKNLQMLYNTVLPKRPKPNSTHTVHKKLRHTTEDNKKLILQPFPEQPQWFDIWFTNDISHSLSPHQPGYHLSIFSIDYKPLYHSYSNVDFSFSQIFIIRSVRAWRSCIGQFLVVFERHVQHLTLRLVQHVCRRFVLSAEHCMLC